MIEPNLSKLLGSNLHVSGAGRRLQLPFIWMADTWQHWSGMEDQHQVLLVNRSTR